MTPLTFLAACALAATPVTVTSADPQCGLTVTGAWEGRTLTSLVTQITSFNPGPGTLTVLGVEYDTRDFTYQGGVFLEVAPDVEVRRVTVARDLDDDNVPECSVTVTRPAPGRAHHHHGRGHR